MCQRNESSMVQVTTCSAQSHYLYRQLTHCHLHHEEQTSVQFTVVKHPCQYSPELWTHVYKYTWVHNSAEYWHRCLTPVVQFVLKYKNILPRNAFEYVACKMSDILFRPCCVNRSARYRITKWFATYLFHGQTCSSIVLVHSKGSGKA